MFSNMEAQSWERQPCFLSHGKELIGNGLKDNPICRGRPLALARLLCSSSWINLVVSSTSARVLTNDEFHLWIHKQKEAADKQLWAEMYAPFISKTNHSFSPNASKRNTNFVFICTAYVPRPKQCIKKDLRQPTALITFIHCSITRAQWQSNEIGS